MDEILNIEYHKQRLILRALNELGSFNMAAEKLGICRRTLRRYKKDYNIFKGRDNVYAMIQKIK